MRKTKLITRGFNITYGQVLTVNVATQQTNVVSFKLIGKFTDKEEVLKAFKNEFNSQPTNDGIIPVAIINYFTELKVYGITEDDFINNGIELDNETRKPINEV